MERPAFGRRARLSLAVVCLATAAVAALGAQTETPPKYSRLQRLEQWTAAVERHEPAQADGALNTFDDWNASEFTELKVTFYSALALVRDPAVRTFFRPPLPNGRPAPQVFYSRGELRDLIAVARRLRAFGESHMLRRGAMLHMDAVVLGAGTDSRGVPRRSDFFVYRFDDGQGLDQLDALGQWEVARFLLEQVRSNPDDFRPRPAGDDWVRRWYRTLIAFQLSRMHFNVVDANRGLELFPNDPEILFFEGVLHETLASPAIQEPLRKSEEVRRLARVRTAAGEFNTAEDLLRRMVKLSPEFAEGRLHLGRVLAEQEQHKEALSELTRALSAITNQDLQYFGQLFAGRSAATLGQIPAARAAFERAAALRPAAQSPLLALSQLAYGGGDSGEATALLARVAELPGLELDDPWWIYNTAVGRFFRPSHQEIADDLRKEMPR